MQIESGLSLKFKNVVKKLNSSAETNARQLGPSFFSLASKTITKVEWGYHRTKDAESF